MTNCIVVHRTPINVITMGIGKDVCATASNVAAMLQMFASGHSSGHSDGATAWSDTEYAGVLRCRLRAFVYHPVSGGLVPGSGGGDRLSLRRRRDGPRAGGSAERSDWKRSGWPSYWVAFLRTTRRPTVPCRSSNSMI